MHFCWYSWFYGFHTRECSSLYNILFFTFLIACNHSDTFSLTYILNDWHRTDICQPTTPSVTLTLIFWGVKTPRCSNSHADKYWIIYYVAHFLLLLKLQVTQTWGHLDKGKSIYAPMKWWKQHKSWPAILCLTSDQTCGPEAAQTSAQGVWSSSPTSIYNNWNTNEQLLTFIHWTC